MRREAEFSRPDYLKAQMETELRLNTPRLREAFELGKAVHEGQMRQSGETYFEGHCVKVAALLQNLLEDAWEDLVVAALLHDTVEDHPDRISLQQIEEIFGSEVARMVDGVSKLSTSESRGLSRKEKDREALRKVAVSVSENVGVSLIKLADRTHNILTLGATLEESRPRKADETIRAYGKLAGILNCYEWRRWLEDAAFPYLDRVNYEWVKETIDNDPRLDVRFVKEMIGQIEEVISQSGISARVEIVLNGYFESWKKMEQLALNRQGSLGNFEAVSDVISFRVVLPGGLEQEEIDNCYRLLYRMQKSFGSFLVQEKFNDYIAVPQQGFMALQSTLYLPEIGEVEIAIETEEMHMRNNWGVVYDLREGNDLSSYKTVSVITPSNSLRFLPDGSRVVDAVVAIQPNLVNNASQVKVNGRLSRMSDLVRPGDLIEVVSGGSKLRLGKDWLSLVNDGTKRILRGVMRREQIRDGIEEGKKIVTELMKGRGVIDLGDVQRLRPQLVGPILEQLGCASLEDLFMAIGGNTVRKGELSKLLDEYGVTKEGLGWTSLRIMGKEEFNVSGSLGVMGEVIANCGGNIIRATQNTNKDGSFDLKMVLEGVDVENEARVKKELEELGWGLVVEVV